MVKNLIKKWLGITNLEQRQAVTTEKSIEEMIGDAFMSIWSDENNKYFSRWFDSGFDPKRKISMVIERLAQDTIEKSTNHYLANLINREELIDNIVKRIKDKQLN